MVLFDQKGSPAVKMRKKKLGFFMVCSVFDLSSKSHAFDSSPFSHVFCLSNRLSNNNNNNNNHNNNNNNNSKKNFKLSCISRVSSSTPSGDITSVKGGRRRIWSPWIVWATPGRWTKKSHGDVTLPKTNRHST